MGNNISVHPYLDLKKHPNYKHTVPERDDTPISFALRFVANLISPKQEDNESYDIECVNIKSALTCDRINREITNIWLTHQLKLKE